MRKMLIRYAFSIKGIEVDETFHALEKTISKERYEKMQRYRFEADRVRSLFAALLLRYALKKHYGIEGTDIEIEKNEYGKPELKNQKDIYFNVSHSGDWVICALSSYPVGVDVELNKEHDIEIAKRFYSEKEYKTLLESDNAKELFITYWTLKESYVKAEGKGMSIPFDSFSFDIKDRGIDLQVGEQLCDTYQFQVYKIADDVQVATCSQEPIEGEFQVIDLDEIKETLLV